MSHLQRVAATVNNLIVTKLKRITSIDIVDTGVPISVHTWIAYSEYNKAKQILRARIEADYKSYAKQYRKTHKLEN